MLLGVREFEDSSELQEFGTQFEPRGEFRASHHFLSAVSTEVRGSKDHSFGDGLDEIAATYIREA